MTASSRGAAMLDNFETGYEGKFDFPLWQGQPTLPYLFASVPRTGSTFLSHLLWRSGCLGAPLEYLNFEPGGPYGFVTHSPDSQQRLWRSVINRRTSPNGVFGLKCFPLQLAALQESNPELLDSVMRMLLSAGDERRIIHLHRRDRAAHAISYARAMLSGVWRKEQERAGQMDPAFSTAAIGRAESLIDEQEGAWAAMYRDLRITPLELWYEDVVAVPEVALAAVADYLGVKIDPAGAVRIPEVERQSQDGAQYWAEKLRGV